MTQNLSTPPELQADIIANLACSKCLADVCAPLHPDKYSQVVIRDTRYFTV